MAGVGEGGSGGETVPAEAQGKSVGQRAVVKVEGVGYMSEGMECNVYVAEQSDPSRRPEGICGHLMRRHGWQAGVMRLIRVAINRPHSVWLPTCERDYGCTNSRRIA